MSRKVRNPGRDAAPAQAAAPMPSEESVASERQTDDNQWLQQAEQAWQERREREQREAEREAGGERTLDLSAVDGYMGTQSGTGESLLVAQASGNPPGRQTGAKDDDDDKGLAWLLVGGGLAAAAGGGGGGGGGAAAPAQVVNNGFVFDGFVRNAVVFRDSDGDGLWDDANGDGIWQTGDEHIVSTDSTGQFTELGGTGRIISTSMDRLIGVNSSGVQKLYTTDDIVLGSNGAAITGPAIDNDTGLPFRGLFISPGVAMRTTVEGNTTTNTVFVSGMSTLTALLLEKRGITNPTQQQIIDAAAEVNSLFETDHPGGVTDSPSAVDFFLSSGSALVAALLGAMAEKAARDGNDPVEVMKKALDALVDAIDNAEDGAPPIDITKTQDLLDLFEGIEDLELSENEAEAIANSTAGDPGAAQISIYHDSVNGEDGKYNNASLDVDGPVGSIAVIATNGEDSATLEILPGEGTTEVELVKSSIRVEAAGEDSFAMLSITNATGSVKSLIIETTGEGSQACAEIDGTNLSFGDNIQIKATADQSGALVMLGQCGDITIENVPEGIVVESSAQNSYASAYIVNASGTVSTVDVKSLAVERVIEPPLDVPEDDAEPMTYTTNSADAFLTLQMDGEILGDINVTADSAQGNAQAFIGVGTHDARELHEFDLLSYINDETNGPQVGDVLTVNVLGTDLTITLGCGDFYSDELSLSTVVDRFNMAAMSEDLGVWFSTDYDGVLEEGLMIRFYGNDNQVSSTLSINGDSGRVSYFETDGSTAGALAIGGNLTATATGEDSNAVLIVGEDGTYTTSGAALTATASGEDSNATVMLGAGEGALSGVNAVASGEDSSANASAGGGRFRIRVIGEDSGPAGHDLTGNVTATASGGSSDAGASFVGNSFTGLVSAAATGDNADAWASVNASSGILSSVTSTASGADSASRVYVYGMGGEDSDGVALTGNVVSTASGSYSFASADVYVASAGGGDVTVTASGNSSFASADVAALDGSLGNLTVTANRSYAGAELEVEIDGTVTGDMTVTAGCADSWAAFWLDAATEGQDQLKEFNFYDFYGTLQSGDVVEMTIGDTVLTTTLSGTWVNESDLAEAIASGLRADPDYASLVPSLYIDYWYYSSGGVYVERSGVEGSPDDISITVTRGTEDLGEIPVSGVRDGRFPGEAMIDGGSLTVTASGDESQAEAELDGVTGTINGITVVASGNSYGSYDVTRASAEIDSDSGIAISGMITVTASGTGSSAELDVDDVTGGTITGISVTASGDPLYWSTDLYYNIHTSASLDIDGTYTVAGNVTVTASGVEAEARAELDGSGEDGDRVSFDSANLTATASGTDSYANAYASGDGSFGTLSVLASGEDADAELDLRIDGSVTGNMTVTASCQDADADLWLEAATEGETQFKEFAFESLVGTLQCGDVVTMTIGDVVLTTTLSGTPMDGYSLASQIANGLRMDSDYAAIGEDGLYVGNYWNTESGVYLQRYGVEGPADDVTISVTRGTADLGAVPIAFENDGVIGGAVEFNDTSLSVTASGHDAEAGAYLRDAIGSINGITIVASGNTTYGEDSASASVDIGGSTDVGVAISGMITVTASGTGAEAWLEADGVTGGTVTGISATASGAMYSNGEDSWGAYASVDIDGSLNVSGDVTATASGEDSEAYVQLHGGEDGPITYNAVAVTATASGEDSDAGFEARGEVAGTIASITVAASGQNSAAWADFGSFDYNDGTATVTGAISTTSSGEDSWSGVRLEATAVQGSVSVTASGEDSYASTDISAETFGSGAITVTASGEDSFASAELDFDTVGAATLTVLASGEDSWASADLDAGTLSGLSIVSTASGSYSSTDVEVSGDAGTIANVTVTASGYQAEATAEISFDGQITGMVSVCADADYADAFAGLYGLSGDLSDLEVTSYNNSTAKANVYLDSGSVHSVAIEARDMDSFVSVDLNLGTASGDISVIGSGDVVVLFQDMMADEIDLSMFDGDFRLELAMDDADLAISTDLAALTDGMLTFEGWADNAGYIDFNNGAAQFEAGMSPYADMNAFLASADIQLDGTTDYFFGTVGTTGYLAYDEDGTGLTALIAFSDVTTLDYWRIDQASNIMI